MHRFVCASCEKKLQREGPFCRLRHSFSQAVRLLTWVASVTPCHDSYKLLLAGQHKPSDEIGQKGDAIGARAARVGPRGPRVADVQYYDTLVARVCLCGLGSWPVPS